MRRLAIGRRSGTGSTIIALALAQVLGPAWAQEAAAPGSIIVIAPGGSQDEDDAIHVAGNRLTRNGAPDMLGTLARDVPGLMLADAQNNPWQPNLFYRGFVASPLQGNAQGMGFYVDGARFNQPFGDTVNFDLIPEVAIDTIIVKDINPIYGLNALGGAIVVATKTGRSAPGLTITGAGGNYGRAEGSIEAGWADENKSLFIALQENHDGGWRRFSPSTLYNGFFDAGWDGQGGGVHVKLIGADNNLTGNGTAPAELLAADRRAVFTHPDNVRNRFGRVSVHPWVALSDRTRLEGSAYWQHLRQRTLNGDAADIEACDDDPAILCLETADEEEEASLVGLDGGTLADVLGGEGYGVLNRSQTRTSANGALVQLVDQRPLAGGSNMLVLGVSHDRSRTRFATSTELGALTDTRSVDGMGQIIAQPDGSVTPVRLTTRTRYTGLFLLDTISLGSGFAAELGLRYNHARVRLVDRIGTALNGRHRFERLNPGVELSYRLSGALTIRAGYAEANRVPTPAELSCADEAAPCSLTNFFVGDPPLAVVVAKSWEAGASGKLGGPGGWQLRWLLSAYRTDNHDDIQFIASEFRGRAFFANIGRTRRQGLEASIDATRGPWSIGLRYALTDATFRSPLTLDSPDNPGTDADGLIAVGRGDELPSIPRHRATLSVDYATDQLTVGAEVQAQSGQWLVGDGANLTRRTRPFALVGLHGSGKLAGPISLFANVTNLFDKRHATFGTFGDPGEVELAEAPDAENPRSLGPGAPRRWMAGVRARF